MRQRMKPLAVLALTFFLVIATIIVAVSMPKTGRQNAVENRASPDLEHASDQNSPNGFVSRTFFDDKENEKRADLLRYKLERDGALAEVDCRVSDRFGNPVSSADIRFYFDTKENRPESEGFVMGKTDENGRFFARHKTTYACHWRIRKEGYYESRGILPFSNHFSWDNGRHGRWTAKPLPLDVILAEKSGVEL